MGTSQTVNGILVLPLQVTGVPELSLSPCQEDGCWQSLALEIKNNRTQVPAEYEHFYLLLLNCHGWHNAC